MTKQIKDYIAQLDVFLAEQHSDEEYETERGRLLTRIGFFSHERLIHLLVTLAFAVFFLLALFMVLITRQIGLLILSVLLLALLIAYIRHYYFLENSVQKLYLYYSRLEKLRGDKK